jgi:N-acetyl-gamma-glutamyl-phosphate reductase
MAHKVFIDGEAGTTGLQIRAASRAAGHRADSPRPRPPQGPAARSEALNAADAVILCLPDDAAREAWP